jgi:hypothetical protein
MSITTTSALAASNKEVSYLTKNTAAAASGVPISNWYTAGAGAWTTAGGSPGSTTTGRIPTNATTGALPLGTIVSGDTVIAYSAAYTGGPAVGGGVCMIADRVFDIGEFTPAVNAAYLAGAASAINRPASGQGVFLGIEIQTTFGATTPKITVTYTNQAGTAGQTTSYTLASAAVAGQFFPLPLVAGDYGVQQITQIGCDTADASGRFNIVAYAPMFSLVNPYVASAIPNKLDWTKLLGPLIPYNACLWPVGLTSNGASYGPAIILALAHG